MAWDLVRRAWGVALPERPPRSRIPGERSELRGWGLELRVQGYGPGDLSLGLGVQGSRFAV